MTKKGSLFSKRRLCGELRVKDVGKEVALAGWVNVRRDHGGLIFIDLRDKSGLVQLVASPDNAQVFALAEEIRSEYVLRVEGRVTRRPEGTENPNLPTGEVEVLLEEIKVLSKAKTPPFEIEDDLIVDEALRLKYRYLDLRRPIMQEALRFRHLVVKTIRDFLDKKGFSEIETPILTKSTPEGARDFLVPSRLQRGHFYALPQSPQLFKQLLMVAGMERYYQIARCFRDEDLRADRQPEHTQVDMEMSFISQDDILNLVEEMMVEVFSLASVRVKAPFLRISHQEAIEKYGTDKPDIRYGLEIVNISEVVAKSELRVFSESIKAKGAVTAINAKGCSSLPPKEIDELVEEAKAQGAKGLAWLKVLSSTEAKSPIAKNIKASELKEIIKKTRGAKGDLLLFVADRPQVAYPVLGVLREKLAKRLGLISKDSFSPLWVVDFPMFEWDEDEKRLKAHHHPFTMPTEDSLKSLEKEPLNARACAYDLVINGVEVGGGSLRIHDTALQKRIFKLLGLPEEEAKKKFGFLLEAFQYGVPPHGGIAFGLDRLVMILLGRKTIRDTIAFPKTQSATCLLTSAPDEVDACQLKELGIKLEE